MNYVEKLNRPLSNAEVDFNIDSLATRLRQVGAEDMSLILRRDLSRPLTSREMDNNFHQLDLITQRLMYGDGPYPTLDLRFAGATMLDPRVEFSRASTATGTGPTGRIFTAAIDEPRFVYDPATGQSEGLLVEGQATNLLRYSLAQSPGWGKTPSTDLIENYGIAPDGTQSTSLVCGATGVTGATYVYAGSHASAQYYEEGKTYCASIYFRRNPSLPNISFRLTLQGFVAPSTSISFDEVSGTVSVTGAPADYGYEFLPGGIVRLWISAVAGTSGDSWPPVFWPAGGNLPSGEGYEIWGAQLEEGIRPTSYIPTESSQVTRAADDANISGDALSSVLNKNEGVLFLDYVPHGPIDASPNVFAMGLSNGSSNNRITFGESSANGPFGNFFWTTEGVNGVAHANTYPEAEWGKRIRVALSWSGQDYALVADGSVLRSGTSSTPFPDVTKLTLGGSGFHGSSRRMNCTFSRAVIYPRALSDAELQALTS